GGPFKVIEKISSHAYRLDLPKTIRVHNVFHVNLLSPFKDDKDFQRRQAKPLPILTEEGEEEYKVDHVVAWEWRKNQLYYQIRWKGYHPVEDTMERADKFSNMHDLLNDLRKRLPDAPMPEALRKEKMTPKREPKKNKPRKKEV
ncbi:hypothetical protein FRC07_001674, partial [Ceratobasidium sp. 392]